MKKLRLFLVFLLMAAAAVAQTAPAPSQPAQTESKPAQSQTSPQANDSEPEYHISQAEADTLFKEVDEILKFDSEHTGLPIKHPVKRKLTSRPEVEQFLLKNFEDDQQAKRLLQAEISLKKFGLLPRDFNLEGFLLEMLKEQVAGYYDPKTKTVYLLDWLDPEAQRPVLVHELVHALQDQNFDLKKFLKDRTIKDGQPYDVVSDEESSARQAVLEGQATAVMIDSMLASQGLSASTSPLMVKAIEAGMQMGENSPVYQKAPLYLKQSLIFPYTYGLDFVIDMMKQSKQQAFTGALKTPPVDTREIMQPEMYLKKEAVPVIPMPNFDKLLGKQWKRFDVGGVGEFDVAVMAHQYGTKKADADALSSGWRQAYYYVASRKDAAVKGPGDVSMLFVSRWDTPEHAHAFANIYEQSLAKRYKSVAHDSDDTWKTDNGDVVIRTEGKLLLVTEGFDVQTAKMLTDAAVDKAMGK